MTEIVNSATVSNASAVAAVLTAVGAAILVPIRWVVGLVKVERDAREVAIKALWEAIEKHRNEEAEHERRISEKFAVVATKADLAQQTKILLVALDLRARAAE